MKFLIYYRFQHVYREGNYLVDITTNEALKCNTWNC